MKIENNILKHYLKNVYFITGTAYAGKSTTVKMLAERYDMIFCGENYHIAVSDIVATPDVQPDLCYRKNLTDWKDFVTRSPEEYERWIYSSGKEGAEFEVAELISISKNNNLRDLKNHISLLKTERWIWILCWDMAAYFLMEKERE